MTIPCTILPVLFAVTFYWMPESPIYLFSKGQTDKAYKSLRWLRRFRTGHSVEIENELNKMQSFVDRPTGNISVSTDQTSLPSTVINLFESISVTSEAVKAMKIVFCGINSLLAYTVEIFQTAGSAWNPYLCTAVFGVAQFVSTLIAIMIADRIGRRILLIISVAGPMVIHFTLMKE
jgi:SP family facilitated glucose transporter-like MFS transporter 8